MKKLLTSILLTMALTTASVFAQATQLQTVSAQKGIQTNGLKKIQISLKNERLTIRQNEDTEDKTLNIEIVSNYTASYPLFKNDGKTIKIEQKEKTNKLKDRICEVTITVPKDFKIQELKASSDSSDISISDFQALNFDVSISSGTLKLSKIEATDFSASSDKGELTARNIKVSKAAKFSSSSGAITVSDLTADEVVTESQKGDLKFSDINVKKVSMNADKGSLDLTLSKLFEKDSTIRVSSGNAKIYLPSNSTFWTSGSVDRGRFRSDFTQDSKGPRLDIKVGGGDLQVLKGSGL